jgi:pilus assembly protein Flp/PilA
MPRVYGAAYPPWCNDIPQYSSDRLAADEELSRQYRRIKAMNVYNKVILAVQNAVQSEEGVTAIEYGLIAALVVVGIVVSLTTIGTDLTNIFQTIATDLTKAAGTG